jgi:hypothetical protein
MSSKRKRAPPTRTTRKRKTKPKALGKNGLKKEPLQDLLGVKTITAIDPGWRNMGVCLYDVENKKVLEWSLVDVAKFMGREKPRNGRADFCGNGELVNKTYELMEHPRFKRLFSGDLIAVEEQHEQFNRPGTENARKKQTDFFKKFQVAMMAFHKAKELKTMSVNPYSVGCWFRTEEQKEERKQTDKKKWYNLNKKESVEQTKGWVTLKEAKLFAKELARRKSEGCCAKPDDMTDAYRIAKYVVQRHIPNNVDGPAVESGYSTHIGEDGEIVIDIE